MSSSTDYLPSRESELVTWTNNFEAILSAAGPGGMLGVSAVQIAAFTTLYNNWITSYNAAHAGPTRGPAATATKNTAKEAMIDGPNGIRELVGIIQHNPATTNTDRQELLITVPDVEPSPVPIPTVAPNLVVRSAVGRTCKVRLQDAQNLDSRAKPEGVFGATIFYYVGDEVPTDPGQWSFLMNSTRTQVDVDWPLTIPGGARVWLTAIWFNTRSESSPPAEARSIRVGDVMAEVA